MNIPNRRCRIDLHTPAEKAICDAILEVEKVGADVRLTQAVTHLLQAQDWVADYVDGETWRMEKHEQKVRQLDPQQSD